VTDTCPRTLTPVWTTEGVDDHSTQYPRSESDYSMRTMKSEAGVTTCAEPLHAPSVGLHSTGSPQAHDCRRSCSGSPRGLIIVTALLFPLLGGNDEEVPGKGPTAPMSQSGCFVVRDPLLRGVALPEGGRTAMPKVFLADDRSMDAVPGWM
jgi:hypothetical protein